MAGKTQYKNEFISNHYDRIYLVVPKGKKALMEEHAKSKNMSLNAYITSLIERDMGSEGQTRTTQHDMDVFLL